MAFFQGSLQEGIATALQQSKSVVCFVTDGETESKLWEEDFFAEEEIRSLLPSQAVTLRLPAGSQEEGFLSQLYPIPKKPTVVIIRNGELKEYIASGTPKDDFLRRMKASLTAPPPPSTQPAAPAPEATTSSTAPPTQPPPPADSSTTSSSSGRATPPSPGTSRIQTLLAERAARLAEKKKADEEAAKQQRAAKAQAKADAEASGLKKPADDQSKHAAALRKKQREAREERQRILKAIEDDKAARRAQRADVEAARRAAAEAAASASGEKAGTGGEVGGEGGESLPFAPASQRLPTSGGRLSGHCALQVRLLDGATIRSRFGSSETLADVRRWVEDNTPEEDKGQPYLFKVLLTPKPSRTIGTGEEGKTLEELGLVPSSTLILLRAPKKRYVGFGNGGREMEGYDPDAHWRDTALHRLLAYIFWSVAGFFAAVARFFSTLFSLSGPPEPTAAESSSSARTSQSQTGVAADAARRRGERIAGLGETDERRNDQQFYNGNSTNFEPRADDGE